MKMFEGVEPSCESVKNSVKKLKQYLFVWGCWQLARYYLDYNSIFTTLILFYLLYTGTMQLNHINIGLFSVLNLLPLISITNDILDKICMGRLPFSSYGIINVFLILVDSLITGWGVVLCFKAYQTIKANNLGYDTSPQINEPFKGEGVRIG